MIASFTSSRLQQCQEPVLFFFNVISRSFPTHLYDVLFYFYIKYFTETSASGMLNQVAYIHKRGIFFKESQP